MSRQESMSFKLTDTGGAAADAKFGNKAQSFEYKTSDEFLKCMTRYRVHRILNLCRAITSQHFIIRTELLAD